MPSTPPTSLVLRAAAFAAERHKDQRRKGDKAPYVNHPLRVARNVAEIGGCDDPEILAAAILHDTIEDTDTTADELREAFTDAVAAMVLEVTDDKALDKVARKKHQIVHARELSPGASLVKMGDKLDNLSDLHAAPPGSWKPDRIRGYFVWAWHVVDNVQHPSDALRAQLDALFSSDVPHEDGTRVRAVPEDPGERAALLETYYTIL